MVNISYISRHSGMSFFAVLNEPSESCWSPEFMARVRFPSDEALSE